MEKYWKVKEAALRFRKSEKTIRAMIQRGDIEAVKFGRDYLIVPFDHYRFGKIRFHRPVTENLKLMRSARESIWLLGINALGPLHQGREILIKHLDENKSVRVLLLDPASDAFFRRVQFEEYHEKEGRMVHSGRLVAEFGASLGILRDIVNFTRNDHLLELRLHGHDPSESLVIVDSASPDHAICHYNPYPPEKQTRGVCGPNFSFSNNNGTGGSEFGRCIGRFTELWESAQRVEIIGDSG